MVTSHSWKILEKGVKLQQPNSQQILKGWSNLSEDDFENEGLCRVPFGRWIHKKHQG